jgi:hypothetical protein
MDNPLNGLITMDFVPPVSHNEIRQVNALEWLMR